jgi:copper chaperone CopZ
MKSFKYLLTVLILITSFGLAAQEKNKDSTVSFRVSGACEMCKERIEKTLKIRGVRSADWNVDSKMLTLVYSPTIVSLLKVHKVIAGVGHDTELEKAKDAVYNELPECCHYRKKEASDNSLEVINAGITDKQDGKIKGVVLEEDKKGSFRPLQGASVIWLGTNKGTVTDSSGIFFVPHDDNLGRLIISYTGYSADTITITDTKELKIILASGKQLNEVKVYAKQRSTYLSALSPIRTQVMTERELFKAACCNLSESFETNPSVDVSYNDAVTGSKQIQLLGLSGNYTQLTVENLPGPRGIATPLGLNSIAGPWVESIQLNKGVGSVANGFESIAGQINIRIKEAGES